MSKVRLNDHYFISWLSVVKQKEYTIEENKIFVDMSNSEYTEFLEEYKSNYKPVLSKIRKVVKELNNLTSKPKMVKINKI